MLLICKYSRRLVLIRIRRALLTSSRRNWAIAMSGGVLILASLWYVVRGRKTYVPPVAKVQHVE